MTRSVVSTSVVTEKDELVPSPSAALFAFRRESLDDALKVGCFGNDDHLRVGHDGVIHDADAVREALAGFCCWLLGA